VRRPESSPPPSWLGPWRAGVLLRVTIESSADASIRTTLFTPSLLQDTVCLSASQDIKNSQLRQHTCAKDVL
jgi:hypothetical protein